MTARKVPLMIPENVWGSLATLAARRHTDVPTLINKAVDEWLKTQTVDLRARRQRARAARAMVSPEVDALAEELYEARRARKTA